MTQFLFVGERPSHQAVKLGATWENGKLAAKQLHDALRALNIDPKEQLYCNLWTTPGVGPIAESVEPAALTYIVEQHAQGCIVVGMGAMVCWELQQHSIPHLQMIHPAARGAIRKKERYAAHVGSVLVVRQIARDALGEVAGC
jgi:hypothetical protein